jgi:peptide subunit release factor 1 (eRF1)
VSIVAESSALESTARWLAGFVAERAPVTTVYLDVDGRRHPRHLDVERHAATVLRLGRTSLNGAAADPSVTADLRRIEDWIRAGFDRSTARGLAFFACSAHDLFEVVALPVSFRDRVVVNHSPAMGQLESVLQEHERIGVLLADRQRARMLVFELGVLTERTEVLDALPRGDAGHADRGDLDHAVANDAHAHLRHAAEAAWHVFQDRPFTRLAVGAPEPIARELSGMLHPYLQERQCEGINIAVGAGLEEIRRAAFDVEHRAERKREAATVARLRDAVASGRRGVAGLADTLQALNERRVETLLVSDGYVEEGWRCPSTGALAAVGPTSPIGGGRMDRVDDVVEDAVFAAINQGCRVEVCVGNADLDVLGRIGALLRY